MKEIIIRLYDEGDYLDEVVDPWVRKPRTWLEIEADGEIQTHLSSLIVKIEDDDNHQRYLPYEVTYTKKR